MIVGVEVSNTSMGSLFLRISGQKNHIHHSVQFSVRDMLEPNLDEPNHKTKAYYNAPIHAPYVMTYNTYIAYQSRFFNVHAICLQNLKLEITTGEQAQGMEMNDRSREKWKIHRTMHSKTIH